MAFQYDLSVTGILEVIGVTEPVGRDALSRAERERHAALPPILRSFWSLTADHPLFSTADVWTKSGSFFRFFYEDIQE